LTHELVVEHVERATAEHLAQAGGNHLRLTARSDMEDHGDVPAIVGRGSVLLPAFHLLLTQYLYCFIRSSRKAPSAWRDAA
jgi:hypothetical protein